jgi:hypothetical protein
VWQTLKDQFHLFGPVSMLVASLAAGILAYVIVILKRVHPQKVVPFRG